LIGQAFIAGALIFDETIAIRIARSIDPAERRFDRRPQLDYRLAVAGALHIKTGKQNEEGGRVDAAVIEPKRHLVQRRHFAAAHLMQDLAGFGVGERIVFGGLMRRQPAQHAARHVR